MARRHYSLPPLTTLSSFEAAARRLSFKDAATELNVTPGAVSHQIKALEGELGVALFDRKHRGVDLTQHGLKLFHSLERSFLDISRVLAQIQRSAEDTSVSVAATTAVSSLWLTPRITRFWKEHGNVPVNQVVSDGAGRHGTTTDLRIAYGKDRNPDKVQTELFLDQLGPVCSPGMREALGVPSLTELARQPLIHLDSDDATWTTWRRWFYELGYHGDIASGLRVNNYTIALQAAQDGAGIVLGWQKLVKPVLDNNSLVLLGENVTRAPEWFYVISDTDDALSPNAILFRNWLLETI